MSVYFCPTSSLDVFREKELIRTLREQYAGKTLMIISHRRSTLTDCRRIVRIEDGRAVEEQPSQSGDPVAQVAK